jgi:thymidylate synthase ThyX
MNEVKIIADSISEFGKRITTFVCTFPRFILPEFNTHRVFSRNAASSRAIPVKKFIDQVINNPAEPIFWGKDQSGMQSFSELSPSDIPVAKEIWNQARDKMIHCAKEMMSIGVHKQIVNRLLEPWFKVTVIVTATEFDNFFKLRCHKNAQPEIQDLAIKMRDCLKDSTPKKINFGDWHVPFGDRYVDEKLSIQDKLKICVARCARVSYLNFDGIIDHKKDYDLHDKLAEEGHWSPFEHCASPTSNPWNYSGNFVGWHQYRKSFEK